MRVEQGIEQVIYWYLYRVTGNKIYLNETQLLNSGIPENLNEAVNMTVTLYNFKFGFKKVVDFTVNENIITIALTTQLMPYLGDYRLVAEYDIPDNTYPDGLRHSKVDSAAYTVVLAGQYVNDADNVTIKSVLSGSLNGESVLEFAQRFGYTGTEQELYEAIINGSGGGGSAEWGSEDW